MNPIDKQSNSGIIARNLNSCHSREGYMKLIRAVADAKLKSEEAAGGGDAPDEPSFELGKAR